MTIKIDAFELPTGLAWSDEYDWTGVARYVDKSVTGAPIIQTTQLSSGRSITFDGSEKNAWLPRSSLDALVDLVALDGDRTLTLHDGRTVTVQFVQPPFKALPCLAIDDVPDPADKFYLLNISLITTGEMQPPAGP